jgi:hypothetical protein
MKLHLLAQITNPVLPHAIGSVGYQNGGNALGKLISGVVGALFVAGFLLAFAMMMLGGIKWITAGGDKTKLETARDEITNSIVGIIVVGASFALTALIANFFGLNLTQFRFPTMSQ